MSDRVPHRQLSLPYWRLRHIFFRQPCPCRWVLSLDPEQGGKAGEGRAFRGVPGAQASFNLVMAQPSANKPTPQSVPGSPLHLLKTQALHQKCRGARERWAFCSVSWCSPAVSDELWLQEGDMCLRHCSPPLLLCPQLKPVPAVGCPSQLAVILQVNWDFREQMRSREAHLPKEEKILLLCTNCGVQWRWIQRESSEVILALSISQGHWWLCDSFCKFKNHWLNICLPGCTTLDVPGDVPKEEVGKGEGGKLPAAWDSYLFALNRATDLPLGFCFHTSSSSSPT